MARARSVELWNDGIAECARLMPKPLGVSNSTVIFFSLLRFGGQRLKAVSKTRASSGEPSTPCFICRGSTTHANCLQLILPVFFRSKVANIRTATASAKPPVIDPRQTPPLSQFQPATVEEITRLINTMPAKSCSLDPIPTWL